MVEIKEDEKIIIQSTINALKRARFDGVSGEEVVVIGKLVQWHTDLLKRFEKGDIKEVAKEVEANA